VSDFSHPQNRLRPVDETPAGEEFENIAPDDGADEAPPPRDRRPLLLGLAAVVGGCLLLSICLVAYVYSRGGPPATATQEVPAGLATATEPATAAASAVAHTAATSTQPGANPPATATQAATATQEPLASLSEVNGDVQVRLSADGAFSPAAAGAPLDPGATILTGQNSRAKITLADGTVVRISSQTQLTLTAMSRTDQSSHFQLDFGKVWAILSGPLIGGIFDIQLPGGLAAVRGTYLSAEYNSTTNGVVVSCLEGSCHYENAAGAVDFGALQQAVSVNGAAPRVDPISANQLGDWSAQNVPEVQTLTPPPQATGQPSDTPQPSPTRTQPPTRTPVPSRTPRPTATPQPTRTPRPTATPSDTPSETATVGPTSTAGTPARLAFLVQPATSPVGSAFKVYVAIQDLNGSTVTTATIPISLTIGTNGGGGSLAGVTTVGPVNGVATFSVSLDKAGAYTLVASSPNFPSAISAAFDVVGSKAILFVINGLGVDIPHGQAVNITITAIEPGGVTSVTYIGTIQFQSGDGQAVLPANYTFTPNDRGSHTFSVIFNTVGSQTLKVYDTLIPSLAGFAGATVK
jgi:hypothetical protein